MGAGSTALTNQRKGWTVAEKAKDTNEQTAPAIAPVMVSMTTEQLQELLSSVKGGGGGGLTGADLKAILESQDKKAQETRAVRHSNADHTHVSAFSHPEGDLKNPKPKLQGPDGKPRETYFNNHRESEDELTPAEIDAYNAITHTCEAREGLWKARVSSRRLLIDVPSYTMDDRANLPDGLVLILRELAQGERAVTPADMAVRIAELERIVKAQSQGIVLATA